MFFKDWIQPWRKPLRRYYLKSLFPCGLTLLVFAFGINSPQLLLAQWQKMTWVLLVLASFLWSCKIYFQYLEECDEVERKIELQAIAVGSLLALTCGMATVLAIAVRLASPSAEHAVAAMLLPLCLAYAIARSYWLWRYLK